MNDLGERSRTEAGNEPPSAKAAAEEPLAAHEPPLSGVAQTSQAPWPFWQTPGGILVDDGQAAGPGQLARGAFLARLHAATSATAAAALGPEWTSAGCPYLDAWFARHERDDAATLERLVRRYAGAAPSADAYVAAACARLSDGIARFREGAPLDEHLAAAGLMGTGPGAVMAKEAPGARFTEPEDPARLAARLGRGAPLDGGAASRLGGALGERFDDVRVHADARAAELAGELGATAFTVGTHVAFAAGEYRPGTVTGDALLAHELVHVAQQRSARADGAGLRRGAFDRPAFEHDADSAAVGALSKVYRAGSDITAAARPRLHVGGLALQRCSSKPKPAPRIGQKELAKGTMTWKLESEEGYDGVARIQISFKPRQSVGSNTLTFLQLVLETGMMSKPLRMDVVWAQDQTVPFYGVNWDPTGKKWGPSGAPEGYRNEPGTGTGTAYLFDAPWVASRDHQKTFESVPVVAETGEMLGALRWGVGAGGSLIGAGNDDCTDAPSAAFSPAVEQYYATPASVGPDPQRVERFDAILDGFAPDDATLTDAHKAQLDPIAAKVKGNASLLVELGGFADASEKDPSAISEKRARAVANYLIEKGVSKGSLRVAGFYGASWARYPPSASESRNRRVQVLVYSGSEEDLKRGASGSGSGGIDAGARSGSGR